MSVMGIKENQVSDILRIVAGILQIGNITFCEDGNYSQIANTRGKYFQLKYNNSKKKYFSTKLLSNNLIQFY